MRLRFLAVGLVVGLVAAACSGGEGGAADSTTPQGPGVEEVAAAAEVLVGRWDDRLAFFVVMASLDAGYSVSQVVEHPADLAADGSIPGVDPVGPPLGMLSPLQGGADASGMGVGGVSAAPRRLILAARAELDPQNQYVDFVDATLGEISDAFQARLAREREFEETIVEVTLVLGGSGYTAEQIVEAIITDSLDVVGPCWFVPGADGPVIPQGTPIPLFETLCSPLFEPETTTTSTTTTSTTAPTDDPGAGGIDGTYVGTAVYAVSLPGFEVVESRVEVVIEAGSVAMTIDYEFRYVPRSINEDPSCTAVVRDLWSGNGALVGFEVEALLDAVSRDILELEGSDCEVAYPSSGTARDEILADFAEFGQGGFSGTVDGGSLTGNFGDYLDITAAKQ